MNLYDKASLIVTPNAYKASKIYAAKPTSGLGDLTFSRPSAQTRRNSAGVVENLANNVPALDYPTVGGCPWWNFPVARTNSVRNNTMVGAVVGTPGILPTNFSANTAGLTQEVVGVGIENGSPYIDIKFSGTATGTSLELQFEAATVIAAITGQTWTNSFRFKIIAQPLPPVNYRSLIIENTSGGSFITLGTQAFTPNTTSFDRYSHVYTTNGGATTAFIRPAYNSTLVIGNSYDFTVRIGVPQTELGAYPSPEILTSGTALTRVIANPNTSGLTSFIGQTEGSWYTEFRTQSILQATGDIIAIRSASLTQNSVILISSSGKLNLYINYGGVSFIVNGPTLGANTTYKVAIRYQPGNTIMNVNGVSYTNATVFAFTDALTTLDYPMVFSNPRLPVLFGENHFYPSLTNAELVALTTRP